jgi:hypothetical protein
MGIKQDSKGAVTINCYSPLLLITDVFRILNFYNNTPALSTFIRWAFTPMI